MTEAIQIYIVESDLPGSASLEAMLKARGFQVKTFHSGEEWLRYKPENIPWRSTDRSRSFASNGERRVYGSFGHGVSLR